MTSTLLSRSERDFIVGGAECSVRSDGRENRDARRIEAALSVIPQATGSARVRMGGNDVIVGVKAELGVPESDTPDTTRILFSAEFSPLANPAFRGRGGEELGHEIARVLERSFYDGPSHRLTRDGAPTTALDHAALMVVSGKACWVLNVDALILDVDGAIADATSMAVKLALQDAKIPRVQVVQGEDADDVPEYDVDDDPDACVRMDVSRVPIEVTICQLGSALVVDPTELEIEASSCALTVSVDREGTVRGMLKQGSGELKAAVMMEAMMLGQSHGGEVHKALDTFMRTYRS